MTFSSLHLYVPTIFLSRYRHYTSYLTCHIIPHIYALILWIFHPFPKIKTGSTFASKPSKCNGGDLRLFTLSESSRYRSVRTRSVTSNILAQQRRRNGTETWRRRSCQCEHPRLTTREKILLKAEVPRRNGNVTYSVNRPLRGHSEDTMPATTDWSAAAGLPTPASQYKLMTSIGFLLLLPLRTTIIL